MEQSVINNLLWVLLLRAHDSADWKSTVTKVVRLQLGLGPIVGGILFNPC